MTTSPDRRQNRIARLQKLKQWRVFGNVDGVLDELIDMLLEDEEPKRHERK